MTDTIPRTGRELRGLLTAARVIQGDQIPPDEAACDRLLALIRGMADQHWGDVDMTRRVKDPHAGPQITKALQDLEDSLSSVIPVGGSERTALDRLIAAVKDSRSQAWATAPYGLRGPTWHDAADILAGPFHKALRAANPGTEFGLSGAPVVRFIQEISRRVIDSEAKPETIARHLERRAKNRG